MAWQVEKMRVLDDPPFRQRLVEFVRRKGALPGADGPVDGQKVADEVAQLVLGEFTEAGGGIQTQTVLLTLGALAGFATQMAIREHLVRPGKMREDQAFTVIRTNDGGIYYFGELLNEGLFNHKPGALSVYAFVGGAAQHLGARRLPDIQAIASRVAGTVGTAGFGVPQLPPEHMPKALPIDLLNRFWNPMRNLLAVSVKAPSHWSLTLGLAAQKVIIKAKDTIDPGLAAQIVMEAAVPMSKVDPIRVRDAYIV
jgi:hypothetical protein